MIKMKLTVEQQKLLEGSDLYVNKYGAETYHIPNYFRKTSEPGVYEVYTHDDLVKESLNSI